MCALCSPILVCQQIIQHHQYFVLNPPFCVCVTLDYYRMISCDYSRDLRNAGHNFPFTLAFSFILGLQWFLGLLTVHTLMYFVRDFLAFPRFPSDLTHSFPP